MFLQEQKWDRDLIIFKTVEKNILDQLKKVLQQQQQQQQQQQLNAFIHGSRYDAVNNEV